MTKKLNIDIIAKDKTKRALTGVQNRLNSVKSSVFSLKGALVGIGAGAVIKSFVDVGREIETLQVRFKFLFGSVDEGALAFDNLTKFAGKVPFSLEAITRASGNLAVVAEDANDLNRILEITGNVAAVTGLDFETTASQIQRAFSGGIAAADIFREKGIRSLLGFKEGAKVTAEETVEAFERAFSGNGRFAKATDDLAQTLEGTISMIGDKYFNFQKDVAEGFFNELKKEFGDLNTFLADNEKQIEDIAEAIGENFASAITKTSQALKDVAPAFKQVATTSGQLIDGFNSLPSEVKTAGIIATLLFGKKGFAVAAALSLIVDKITDIADVAQDLSIVDPNDLTNVDVIQDKLKLVNEELKKAEQAKVVPLTMTLTGGVEIDLGEVLDVDAQSEYNKLIEKRNALLRILNNLNFEASDLYSNINIQIKEQEQNTKDLNKELEKGALKSATADARDRLALDKSQNKVLEERLKREEEIKKLYEATSIGIERLQEVYDPYLALQREEQENLKMIEDAQKLGIATAEEAERLKTETLAKGIKDRKALRDQEVNEQLRIFKSGKFQELKFNELSEEAKKDFTIKAGKEVLGALARNNKKAFELNKALATAEAIVNTAQGVTKALSTANYIQAFLIGAMGAVQIASIQSQQYQGRAMGGRVQAGSSYMVGEGGKPEMFVPDQSGTIIPNSQLARQTTVNVNVYANDTEGFDDLLVKRRSTIVNVINDALNSQGKEALI
jgi:SLT domain-containing protein